MEHGFDVPVKAFGAVISQEEQPGDTDAARRACLPIRHLQASFL
jgi:hypothetical protein